MDLHRFIWTVRNRYILMLGVLGAVLLGAAVVTWRMTPVYQATATVEVLPATSAGLGQPTLENTLDPSSALQSQVELVKGGRVLTEAGERLGLTDPSTLREALSVELIPGTQIVSIQIEHASPREASEFANTVANSYIDFRRERAEETSLAASEAITRQIEEIRSRMAELQATGQAEISGSSEKVEHDRLAAQVGALEGQLLVLPDAEALRRGGGTIVSLAEAPELPIRPNKVVNMGFALAVGLAMAIGVAILAEALDDRIKDSEDVENVLKVPVLGYIPIVDGWAEKEVPYLAIDSETSNSAAEAYRTLRTNLRFASLNSPIKSILITSPTAGAGKTTTATNLAAIFATGGSKTILVAGDLRKPAAHRVLGLDNGNGIAQSLDAHVPLHQLLQRHEATNLRFLGAGGVPPNPTEVLASGRFGAVLEQLAKASDLVIIDSPPILGLGDVSALASRVDGVLLVINASTVARKELLDAADQIRKAGGKIIGCVMNAVDPKDGYGYYYQNYYADYSKESASRNGTGSSDAGTNIFGDTSTAVADPVGKGSDFIGKVVQKGSSVPPEEIR